MLIGRPANYRTLNSLKHIIPKNYITKHQPSQNSNSVNPSYKFAVPWQQKNDEIVVSLVHCTVFNIHDLQGP